MLYGCNRPSAADSQKGGNVRGKAKHSRKGTYLIWTSSKGDSFEWQREEARGGKYRSAIFNLSHLVAHFHQLLTFGSTPKNIFLANLTKKIGIVLIHSHQTVAVVLAAVTFSLSI